MPLGEGYPAEPGRRAETHVSFPSPVSSSSAPAPGVHRRALCTGVALWIQRGKCLIGTGAVPELAELGRSLPVLRGNEGVLAAYAYLMRSHT